MQQRSFGYGRKGFCWHTNFIQKGKASSCDEDIHPEDTSELHFLRFLLNSSKSSGYSEFARVRETKISNSGREFVFSVGQQGKKHNAQSTREETREKGAT